MVHYNRFWRNFYLSRVIIKGHKVHSLVIARAMFSDSQRALLPRILFMVSTILWKRSPQGQGLVKSTIYFPSVRMYVYICLYRYALGRKGGASLAQSPKGFESGPLGSSQSEPLGPPGPNGRSLFCTKLKVKLAAAGGQFDKFWRERVLPSSRASITIKAF